MDTLTRMRAFIEVVEAEGFAPAARKIGRSKALLSKYVRDLEDELGALLLNRTTRQFSLTEAGHTYYRRSCDIIDEIDNLADTVRAASGTARGRIRLSASRAFADASIGRSLIDFAKDHPEIMMEIHLDDHFIDLVEEGFDLAIRISRLEDSSLIARRLHQFSVRICASPELIETYGRPEHPRDLSTLPCIVDTNNRGMANWSFCNERGEAISTSVSPRLQVNSPLASMAAAITGLGFAALPDFVAAIEIEKGRLLPVLDDFILPGGGIYAVYPHRRYLPAKVRLLVDYLAQWFKTRR